MIDTTTSAIEQSEPIRAGAATRLAIFQPADIPNALYRASVLFRESIAYVDAVDRMRTLTFSELYARARQAAAGLVALGLEPGDRVAICAENSIDWIIAFHASSMAGAIAVLVYPELTSGEIRAQIQRPDCRFVFASAAVFKKLNDQDLVEQQQVVLGDRTPSADRMSLAEVASKATDVSRQAVGTVHPRPDDVAVVIYTSGTTAGPKGVMLSHRNLLSNASSGRTALDVGRRDSVLLVLPLHHAMPFMATVILPLLAGATVVIENDLRHIRDSLQKYRPTVFFGVPGLYDLMLRSFSTAAESKGKLSQFRQLLRISKAVKGATAINIGPFVFRPVHKALGGRLRFMVSGGAALNPQTQADYLALGLPLIQGWGMSEASPLIAVQPFSSSKFLFTRYYERHLGSVGPAAPGVQVRLTDVPDKGIRVVNDGEGEILARGDNIFLGYWDAPEATNAVKSQGWLATGDLGRIAPDGSIYLTGRSKNVIVLDSGEKVQPEELELLLSQSELISEVCVIGRIVRGKTVVAAVIHPAEVTTGPASTRSADDFRAELQVAVERICKKVATYKRIGLIEVALEPLPRTALGKIARASI